VPKASLERGKLTTRQASNRRLAIRRVPVMLGRLRRGRLRGHGMAVGKDDGDRSAVRRDAAIEREPGIGTGDGPFDGGPAHAVAASGRSR